MYAGELSRNTAGHQRSKYTDGLQSAENEPLDAPLTWRTLGLETMASMLVVDMRPQGGQCFTARCQWPRFHPLNERAVAVQHHPLIMVESTRQIALALRRHNRPATALAPLEPVSVNVGVTPGTWPIERGSATEVDVRVSVSELVREAGVLSACRVTAEYRHDQRPVGSCTMQIARPTHPGEPEGVARTPGLLYPSAAAVGAAGDPDVMIARAPQGKLVIAPRDPAHPVLLASEPDCLPTQAVLEAGRQAVLLTSGMTAPAVVGLHVRVQARVPLLGSLVEVVKEPGGARFLVTASGRAAATGTVALLGQGPD
ncbi:AfsA-related hotdog domain-containing protein [Streptomyces luteocolor]|uniref:AfsA-related hotdog domain-containing protein n=1 Tax=Streptomyces luteocolor TaxID=285500 RepID=UPI000852C794|nr:hypothetical protein [Streptomyces luteocolor]